MMERMILSANKWKYSDDNIWWLFQADRKCAKFIQILNFNAHRIVILYWLFYFPFFPNSFPF